MTPVLGEIVGWELLLVLLLIALLFGSSKLPGLARSMGQATKEFRKGIEDGANDDDDAKPTEKPADDKPAPPS
jgi:sec-independent protein translocase protein TatA